MPKAKPRSKKPNAQKKSNKKPLFDRARPIFLKHLAENANVIDAAEAANFDISGLYKHRRSNEEFAAQWQEALDIATDRARAACYKRGVIGLTKKVHSGGKVLGEELVFSDRMLELWLKAHDPAFKDKMAVSGVVATTVTGNGEGGAVLVEHSAAASITNILNGIAAAKAG